MKPPTAAQPSAGQSLGSRPSRSPHHGHVAFCVATRDGGEPRIISSSGDYPWAERCDDKNPLWVSGRSCTIVISHPASGQLLSLVRLYLAAAPGSLGHVAQILGRSARAWPGRRRRDGSQSSATRLQSTSYLAWVSSWAGISLACPPGHRTYD